MKGKLVLASMLTVFIVVTSVGTAHARWGDGWRGDEKRKMDRKRMHERIGLMKMWKLTETLDLDQETAAKLFPLMHEFDTRQMELRQKRHDTIRLMQDELDKSAANPDALDQLIDRFKQNERAMVELSIQRLESFSKVLSEEQIAKMIALLPRFEQGMRNLFGEAHARRRGDRMRMKDQMRTPPGYGPGPESE